MRSLLPKFEFDMFGGGGELLWGKREDNDVDSGEDVLTQIPIKYSFSGNDFR